MRSKLARNGHFGESINSGSSLDNLKVFDLEFNTLDVSHDINKVA